MLKDLRGYKSFPYLLRDLMDERGDGKVARIATRAEIRPEVVRRWLRGIELPHPTPVWRLSQRFQLDFEEVMVLLARDWDRKLRGVKIPLPDLTDLRRGPAPRPRTKSS